MVRGHAVVGDIPPLELTDYFLLKHFKCLPSQLDQEENERLMEFLEIDSLVQREQARRKK